MDKQQLYQDICGQLSSLLSQEKDITANMANTSALLYLNLPDINWVGFYRNTGHDLLLGPFQGKPACIRIPYEKGVCGACVTSKQILRIADVHAFPGHIACDCASRSEIVLPIFHHGAVIALLDIDAPIVNRFDEADEQGLINVIKIFEQSLIED